MFDAGALTGKVEAAARAFFKDARGSHGWDHVERVLRLCDRIGPGEGADMTVLRLAALLHDIARAEGDRANGGMCHAEHGARMAEDILREAGADGGLLEAVSHCVAAHRLRRGHAPESVEAKVLFDADKLDSIGAVGVGRAFQFAGEIGARLHDPAVDPEKAQAYGPDDTAYREYLVKLRLIKERMLTRTGRRLAEDRHGFMEAFFERLNAEVEGRL